MGGYRCSKTQGSENWALQGFPEPTQHKALSAAGTADDQSVPQEKLDAALKWLVNGTYNHHQNHWSQVNDNEEKRNHCQSQDASHPPVLPSR